MAPLPTAAPGSRFHRTAARPVSPVPAPAAAAGAPSATTASWRSLARHALYRDALAVAVGEGFDAQCEQLRAEDLVLLGDVARLGGDTQRADQAYRAALRRFPGLDRPAFSLGVMSFEARHDYRDAASWLSRYLREHPTGPLATEAAGRLLEAWDLAGETTKAREAARAYLRDHPTGPHRGLARRLAGP
jgi:TolA-binding protein